MQVPEACKPESLLIVIALDPADSLLRKHIPDDPSSNLTKVVEIGGRYGFAAVSLVEERPNLVFEVCCDSQDFLQRGEALVNPSSKDRITFKHVASLSDLAFTSDSVSEIVYVIRNVFWNWADDDATKLLQSLVPTLRTNSSTRILITDGVSPVPKQFPPHVEIAYRRRDITTMTMHNVKQRSQAEWLALFSQVDPDLTVSIILSTCGTRLIFRQVKADFETSAHVFKGIWELRLGA